MLLNWQCFSSMHEVLVCIPNTASTRHSDQRRNPSIQEMEAVGSEVQGHPRLQSEFKVSLICETHHLQTSKQIKSLAKRMGEEKTLPGLGLSGVLMFDSQKTRHRKN